MNISSKTTDWAAPIALLAIMLILWGVIVTVFSVPTYILPSPIAIGAEFSRYYQAILTESLTTLWSTMIGFGLALAVGCVLGAIIGTSRLAHKSAYPLLVGFNAIPKSAFVPILVVWFGSGTTPAVATAFLLSFFPITVNVATGLATLEPELEDVLRALGAKRLDILFKVGVPRSLPYLFAACKIAITLAFVGTIVSETVASDKGIGYLMMSASSSLRMPLVFAGLLTISVMAVIMYQFFAVIETRTTRWAHRHE